MEGAEDYMRFSRNEVGRRSKQDTDSENDCIQEGKSAHIRRSTERTCCAHRSSQLRHLAGCFRPRIVDMYSHRWSDKVDLVRVIGRRLEGQY